MDMLDHGEPVSYAGHQDHMTKVGFIFDFKNENNFPWQICMSSLEVNSFLILTCYVRTRIYVCGTYIVYTHLHQLW